MWPTFQRCLMPPSPGKLLRDYTAQYPGRWAVIFILAALRTWYFADFNKVYFNGMSAFPHLEDSLLNFCAGNMVIACVTKKLLLKPREDCVATFSICCCRGLGFWRRVHFQVDADVSENDAVSSFRGWSHAALYPLGKNPRYPLYKRLGGSQSRSWLECLDEKSFAYTGDLTWITRSSSP
jgi:hypothetical protein